jgi:phosphoribosyl 1,2-cyclic phosphodiesterase
VDVTFYGTRGSCPCSGHRYRIYGGNTSAGLVRTERGLPLILDLGSGLRSLGQTLLDPLPADGGPVRATILLTHLHFDHILGLPFFGPLLMQGAELDVYGPRPETESLEAAFDSLFRPPFFPLALSAIGGRVSFHEVADEEFEVNGATITARRAPHPGNTLGFRIEADGSSMVYLPDHQAPKDRLAIADGVLELCQGVDLVVHDAQYTEEEFDRKWNWGHSTPEYAVRVAAEAHAQRLLLFHHDPSHDDDGIAAIEQASKVHGAQRSLHAVEAAREGTTIDVRSGPNPHSGDVGVGAWQDERTTARARTR